MVNLTAEQSWIADTALKAVHNNGQQMFSFCGLGGTGKSVTMAAIATALGTRAIPCTPTWKAADVFRRKSGLDVQTVHGAIYRFNGEWIDDAGNRRLAFKPRLMEGALRGKVLCIDEASLVGLEMLEDMWKTGASIIACGDPGQLKPVMEAPGFPNYHAQIMQVQRQAWDSPILRQAYAVREGRDMYPDGNEFQIASTSDWPDFQNAGMILCWTNKLRYDLNDWARQARGIPIGTKPQIGDILMCLGNAPAEGLFNGATYRLVENVNVDFQENKSTDMYIEDQDGRRIHAVGCDFTRLEPKYIPLDDNVIRFDYGYACTVHKAQGSETDRVLLFDQMPRHYEDYSNWAYTALTRARTHVKVIR